MVAHRKQNGFNAFRSIVMESVNVDTAITWQYDDIFEGESAIWDVKDKAGDEMQIYRFKVNRFQNVDKMVAVYHQRAIMMAFWQYISENNVNLDEFFNDGSICAVKNIVEKESSKHV